MDEPSGGAGPADARGPDDRAFGWWPSPWSASTVAAGKVSRSGLQADGRWIYWTEGRPDLGGLQVEVRSRAGRPPVDVSPPGVSIRSRVHEYGGRAATPAGGVLFYVDQADQRWYRTEVGEEPDGRASRRASAPVVALTPEIPHGGPSVRYADGWLTPSGRWLLCIEERVAEASTTHRLVAVPVDGSLSVVPLVEHGDFVNAPRPSPDGAWLAWTTWDHPSMPWDSSELWVARLVESAGSVRVHGDRRVAGGDGSSVGQPHWCRDGSLLFADDRSGWWLPYRVDVEGLGEGVGAHPAAQALVDLEAEFHAPDWVVGQSTMAELSDGSIACRMHSHGRDQVVRLRPAPPAPGGATVPGSGSSPRWSVEVLDQPCLTITGVAAGTVDEGSTGTIDDRPGGSAAAQNPDRLYVLGSTATESQAVFEVPLDGASPARRISIGAQVPVAAVDVSTAVPITAATDSGPVPGLFFAPTNARVPAPAPGSPGPSGVRPPLVVFCHGGPTSAAEVGFDPVVQFFTSRGLAVAVVDYRGSSGYGRSYRRRLEGLWGESDVDDCVNYAVGLAESGLVDGDRMAIRGTSAGGLTALAALIRSRRFAGAATWYGVTDLEALAADTHDFESRYVDSLVGPWPEAAEAYRARSPLHHPDQVRGAVLLLQGQDDPVVPASQAQRFAERLLECDVPCTLTVFQGESHGFRRADTIEASLQAELDFYRSLFAGVAAPGDPGDRRAR